MRRLRTDWPKRKRAARQHIANMPNVDERDVGNRPGVSQALGFDDATFEGPPEHECEGWGCRHCLGAA